MDMYEKLLKARDKDKENPKAGQKQLIDIVEKTEPENTFNTNYDYDEIINIIQSRLVMSDSELEKAPLLIVDVKPDELSEEKDDKLQDYALRLLRCSRKYRILFMAKNSVTKKLHIVIT